MVSHTTRYTPSNLRMMYTVYAPGTVVSEGTPSSPLVKTLTYRPVSMYGVLRIHGTVISTGSFKSISPFFGLCKSKSPKSRVHGVGLPLFFGLLDLRVRARAINISYV